MIITISVYLSNIAALLIAFAGCMVYATEGMRL